MQTKSVLQMAPADIGIANFTASDASTPVWLTGQAAVVAGAPVISTNRVSLPNTAKFGLTHASSDVMVRAKAISMNGEAVYVRGDANGYWFAYNNAAGNTVFGYFAISGSVTTIYATIPGAAVNDVLTLLAQGGLIELIRTNTAGSTVTAQANNVALGAGAKEHGVRNQLGLGAVLMDDAYITAIY